MEDIKTTIDRFVNLKDYKDQFVNTDIKNIISHFIQLDDIMKLSINNRILHIWLKSAIARHVISINSNQMMKLLNNNGIKVNNIIVK